MRPARHLCDLDGDGVADIAAGAPSAGAGSVQVFSGATGNLLYTLNAGGSIQTFGHAIAEVGDVDGDGTPDLAIGAPGQEIGGYGYTSSAAVIVVSGNSGATILTLTSTATFVEGFGVAVAGPGDLSGDGIPDIAVGGAVDADGTPDPAIGAPDLFGSWGRVEVHSGATGQLLYGQDAPDTLASGSIAGEHYGRALAGLGDIDNDGAAELAVGAPYPFNNCASAGRVELITPFVQPANAPRNPVR